MKVEIEHRIVLGASEVMLLLMEKLGVPDDATVSAANGDQVPKMHVEWTTEDER